ncbi:MAG: rhodanese-like domain-containing protein [Flavobacteriales bacterium]|nr:rhodanese-like domain-containing protein [Flavobacteriales bacterium]
MKYCSVEEVKKEVDLGRMLILDIRESYEVDICSIDSMQIPMGQICDRVSEIPTNKTIAVLCKSGKRAEAVANLMCVECGFTNVVVVEGGMMAWIEKVANHLEVY